MIYLGYSLPSAIGYRRMVSAAREAGADTFAFYTRQSKKLVNYSMSNEDALVMGAQIEEAQQEAAEANAGPAFGPLVVHAAYSMNLAYPEASIRERAMHFFRREMRYLEALPSCAPAKGGESHYYNIHAGRHNGDGPEKAIAHIAAALNEILEEDFRTKVLLETLPGKGSEVGGNFEELAAILERLDRPEKVGICLDSCHMWDKGYDIVTDPEKMFRELDRILGLEKVWAVHLNDSFYERGAHMDTHERIGKGTIGEEALRYFVQHPALQDCPFILETPGDAESHRQEISRIREWMTP